MSANADSPSLAASPQKPSRPSFSSDFAADGGTAVWVYQGGSWALSADHSEPGYVPGAPPAAPGEYDGQVVRMTSIPVGV
jgi:hypothetical protein